MIEERAYLATLLEEHEASREEYRNMQIGRTVLKNGRAITELT
jgi:hypothetical protein